MQRRRSVKPDGAVTVVTYADLDAYIYAFHEGKLNLLIVVGDPGTQKSHLTAAAGAAGGDAVVISGRNSALGVYLAAYHNRDGKIILDDVDGLCESPAGRAVLKELCSTQAVKQVTWNTENSALAAAGIPKRFTTRSKVAIVVNSWPTVDARLGAVGDRGHVVFFEPKPLEIHGRVADWFWDQEVYSFIGERLPLFRRLSMRLYVKAAEAKAAGLDWRRLVLTACFVGRELVVAQLKSDPKYVHEEDRVREFIVRTGASRATYFNCAKRLVARVSNAPNILLVRGTPPSADVCNCSVLDLIQATHRSLGHG